jgi:uncharacterized protein YceH (UPF0502 family)
MTAPPDERTPEQESPSTSRPQAWPVLTVNERRILGVLIEKAKTTPDVYPLSVNALVTGSNQKSNRDPLLNLSDDDVEEALASAQQKGLAIKITGSRVVRWRHNLYEAWHVDKIDLAILAELLLRGPQTEGELRGRASRMEPIDDIDALRAELRPLAERRLIVYLSPEGKRGTVLTHGFHDAHELDRLRSRHSAGATSSEERHSTPASDSGIAGALEARMDETQADLAALRSTVSELQTAVAALARQINELRSR